MPVYFLQEHFRDKIFYFVGVQYFSGPEFVKAGNYLIYNSNFVERFHNLAIA